MSTQHWLDDKWTSFLNVPIRLQELLSKYRLIRNIFKLLSIRSSDVSAKKLNREFLLSFLLYYTLLSLPCNSLLLLRTLPFLHLRGEQFPASVEIGVLQVIQRMLASYWIITEILVKDINNSWVIIHFVNYWIFNPWLKQAESPKTKKKKKKKKEYW